MNNRLFDFTSLTDILASGAGIMILLALMTMTQFSPVVQHRVEVSMEGASHVHSPYFILISEDRVYPLPVEEIMNKAIGLGDVKEDAVIDLGLQVSGKFSPLLGLTLKIKKRETWPSINDLDRPDSPLSQSLAAPELKEWGTYFFVYDDPAAISFSTFRTVRERLKTQGIDTGWRPVNDAHPPVLCSWYDTDECIYNMAL